MPNPTEHDIIRLDKDVAELRTMDREHTRDISRFEKILILHGQKLGLIIKVAICGFSGLWAIGLVVGGALLTHWFETKDKVVAPIHIPINVTAPQYYSGAAQASAFSTKIR